MSRRASETGREARYRARAGESRAGAIGAAARDAASAQLMDNETTWAGRAALRAAASSEECDGERLSRVLRARAVDTWLVDWKGED